MVRAAEVEGRQAHSQPPLPARPDVSYLCGVLKLTADSTVSCESGKRLGMYDGKPTPVSASTDGESFDVRQVSSPQPLSRRAGPVSFIYAVLKLIADDITAANRSEKNGVVEGGEGDTTKANGML